MNSQPMSSPAVSAQMPGVPGAPVVAPSYPKGGSTSDPSEISDDLNIPPDIAKTLNYSVAVPATAAITERFIQEYQPTNAAEGGFVSGSVARFEIQSSGTEVLNGRGSWFQMTVCNADTIRGASYGQFQSKNANGAEDHIQTVTILAGANKVVISKLEKYNFLAHVIRMFQPADWNKKDFFSLDYSGREVSSIHLTVPMDTQKTSSYVPTLIESGATASLQPPKGFVGSFQTENNQVFQFQLRACNFLMSSLYIPICMFGVLIIELQFADGREAIDCNISHSNQRFGASTFNKVAPSNAFNDLGTVTDTVASTNDVGTPPTSSTVMGVALSVVLKSGKIQNSAQVPPRFRYFNLKFFADIHQLSNGMVKSMNAVKNGQYGIPFVFNDFKMSEGTLGPSDMSSKQLMIWGTAANIIRGITLFNPRAASDHQLGHGYKWQSVPEKIVGLQYSLASYRWPRQSRQSMEEMYAQMRWAMDATNIRTSKVPSFESYALLDPQGNPITRKGNTMDPACMALFGNVNDMGTTDIYVPMSHGAHHGPMSATAASTSIASGPGHNGKLNAINIITNNGGTNVISMQPRLSVSPYGPSGGTKVRFGAGGEWTQWFSVYQNTATQIPTSGAHICRLEGSRTENSEGAISKISDAISRLQLFRSNGISMSFGTTSLQPNDPLLANNAGKFGGGLAAGSDIYRAVYDITGCNPAFVSSSASNTPSLTVSALGSLTDITGATTSCDSVVGTTADEHSGFVLFKPVRVYCTNGTLRCQSGFSTFGSPALYLNERLGFYFPVFARRNHTSAIAFTEDTAITSSSPLSNVWHPTGPVQQISVSSVVEGPIRIQTMGAYYAAQTFISTPAPYIVAETSIQPSANQQGFPMEYGTFCLNIGVPGHYPSGYNEKIESSASEASAGYVRAAPYIGEFCFAQKFKLHDAEVMSGISTLGSNALTATIQLWSSVTREYYVRTVIEYTKMAMIGAQGNTTIAE